MNPTPFDQNYWDTRYQNRETGWDIGYVSTPIKDYIDQLTNRTWRILLPGAGNSYEAIYLLQQGFEQVHILDISPTVCQRLQDELSEYIEQGRLEVHCEDFFDHQNTYDLVLEQTFFCALSPDLRAGYIQKMHELTRPTGRLVGVLFDRVFDHTDRPPFGGKISEYVPLFAPYFDLHTFATCYNSVPPRAGTECFINLRHLEA
ncbi:MAG TPA: methyltransferase [Chitinophagales bacterium]|nr:methyltransferase [Chitinophagales bacterium]